MYFARSTVQVVKCTWVLFCTYGKNIDCLGFGLRTKILRAKALRIFANDWVNSRRKHYNTADYFINANSSATAQIIVPCAQARLYKEDNDTIETIHESNNNNVTKMNRERRHNQNHEERKGKGNQIININLRREAATTIIFIIANNNNTNLKHMLKSLTEKPQLQFHVSVTALRIPLLLYMR